MSTLESRLAKLSTYGTALATAVIAIGLASSGAHIVAAGIALLIALPMMGLIVMLVAFVRARDYRFAAITTTVLLIMLAGSAMGLHHA